MLIHQDVEYQELLEKLILQKEKEYGSGWALDSGAIRNQAKNVYDTSYKVSGREKTINHIQKALLNNKI